MSFLSQSDSIVVLSTRRFIPIGAAISSKIQAIGPAAFKRGGATSRDVSSTSVALIVFMMDRDISAFFKRGR